MLFSNKMNTVIFDIGKVLADYDWKFCLETLGYHGEIQEVLANAIFLNEAWLEGDRGNVTPDNWVDLFISNAPEYEREIRHIYANLDLTIRKYPYTDQMLSIFRDAGFCIYYLSNYSEYLYMKTRKELDFIEDFEGGVFSWQENYIKPQEEIYTCILSRYNINSSETWFFDDRLENVQAAERAGMHGVLFDQHTLEDILIGKYTGGIKT